MPGEVRDLHAQKVSKLPNYCIILQHLYLLHLSPNYLRPPLPDCETLGWSLKTSKISVSVSEVGKLFLVFRLTSQYFL